MIVDVYHLLVTKSGEEESPDYPAGRHETYELRVQSETSPTLVSVICDAWMNRNHRQPVIFEQGKPFSYQYSELASYENRQNIGRQGFCVRIVEDAETGLHLSLKTKQNRAMKHCPAQSGAH